MKLLLFIFLPLISIAHPGTGIVADKKSNIFYTDLEKVWKISLNGTKSVVVKNVHTHLLYMDDHDNLYGQHSMYSGEATNEWSYYVWRLNPAGKLDTIIKPTNGYYIDDFSFVWDTEGNKYWIQHWKQDKIVKTNKFGKTSVLATGDFKNVQWMHVVANKLYFVKEDDIFLIDTINKIQIFAKDLNDKKESQGHNSLFGLWSDDKMNLYVANTDRKKVQLITQNGAASDFYISENGWMPTGGVFDKDGNLWLLEASLKNDVRVKKITSKDLKARADKIPINLINYLLPASICIGMVLIISLVKNYLK